VKIHQLRPIDVTGRAIIAYILSVRIAEVEVQIPAQEEQGILRNGEKFQRSETACVLKIIFLSNPQGSRVF
jgi:hypothetical protein